MVKSKKRISLVRQAGMLKSKFPESKINRFRESTLTWTCMITPTPLSQSYTLKLKYKNGEPIEIYVIEPLPLKLADDKDKLPHVYEHTKQKLCLYYPNNGEWNRSMYYTKSIIPWACEWLLHYELWVCTGTWNGGGIEHIKKEKRA